MKLAVMAGVLLAAVPIGLGLAGAFSTDDGGQEPAVISQSAEGPFRGGRLPGGVRGAKAFEFELADARGGRTGTADLAGRPYALTFLYTECPDVCPLIGAELRRALESLGARAQDVAALAVSVDPEGDTPAAVRDWLDRHRLPRNFHYLVGSESELKPVWDAYYAAPQIPGRPDSTHTASIWLIDGRGRIRTKFSAGVAVRPEDIAHDFEVLLAEQRPARFCYRASKSAASPGRPKNEKTPHLRGFSYAPRETRTPTAHTGHKALNLARLPIPPQARDCGPV